MRVTPVDMNVVYPDPAAAARQQFDLVIGTNIFRLLRRTSSSRWRALTWEP